MLKYKQKFEKKITVIFLIVHNLNKVRRTCGVRSIADTQQTIFNTVHIWENPNDHKNI